MLMDDLGAADGAAEGVELFKGFFNAQDRKQRFKRLMPSAQSKQDVALGVIGSSSDQRTSRPSVSSAHTS